jgi:hypothetical protein
MIGGLVGGGGVTAGTGVLPWQALTNTIVPSSHAVPLRNHALRILALLLPERPGP